MTKAYQYSDETVIFAVDQSLAQTGLAIIVEGNVLWREAVKTKASQAWQIRIRTIINAISRLDNEWMPTHYCLEGYAYAGSFKAFLLGELGGIIKWHFAGRGRPYYQIPIQHHKMYVSHNGRATKRQVLADLGSKFGIYERNDNIGDAISMGLYLSAAMDFWSGKVTEVSLYDRKMFEKLKGYETCPI